MTAWLLIVLVTSYPANVATVPAIATEADCQRIGNIIVSDLGVYAKIHCVKYEVAKQ